MPNNIGFTMNKETFVKNFSKNLKKIIDNNFKNQKEFAEFFDEQPQTINKWVKIGALPDLFKIYKICEAMGITIDYLIKGEPVGITATSIDYEIFDEVVKLTNEFGKENNIQIGGKQYLAVYENVLNMKRLNDKLSTAEIFNGIKTTLKAFWQ
jgi:transcriptional regulator with XRE-family HTH domain